MHVKNLIKKILTKKSVERLKKIKRYPRWIYFHINGSFKSLSFCETRQYTVYHIKNKNIFFGYYDLQQYDRNLEKILAHVVDRNANTAQDSASLVWFKTGDCTPHEITQTHAWCWQQGARLRWHPIEENTILYNDFEDGKYVAKQCRLDGTEMKIVSRALYDVDDKFEYGLGLNFARLQRLRPGYGYDAEIDWTKYEAAPINDGVFLINLKSGEEKLLFSLRDLANELNLEYQHYINHISIAPSGKRFTFFHLWTKGVEEPWFMRFYVSNIDGTGLKCLEEEICISHYAWIDDKKMLATGTNGTYIVYNTISGERTILDSEYLQKDGHPSALINGFLSDTYPQKNSMQSVFRIDYDGSHYKEILRVFSDPCRFGEYRCDLHPRVTNTGKVIIDTTFLGEVRSMVAFDLNEEEIGR